MTSPTDTSRYADLDASCREWFDKAAQKLPPFEVDDWTRLMPRKPL